MESTERADVGEDEPDLFARLYNHDEKWDIRKEDEKNVDRRKPSQLDFEY